MSLIINEKMNKKIRRNKNKSNINNKMIFLIGGSVIFLLISGINLSNEKVKLENDELINAFGKGNRSYIG
jgi:hypothetical protein